MGKVLPQVGVLHYLPAAGLVILLHRYLCSNILLGNTQHLFNPQLNGKPMGVPACLTLNKKTLLSFIAAKYILNGSGHNVVNSGNSVCRWRPFVKDETRMPTSGFQTLVKGIVRVPCLQHLTVHL